MIDLGGIIERAIERGVIHPSQNVYEQFIRKRQLSRRLQFWPTHGQSDAQIRQYLKATQTTKKAT